MNTSLLEYFIADIIYPFILTIELYSALDLFSMIGVLLLRSDQKKTGDPKLDKLLLKENTKDRN